jgi:hypothetical protein
MWHILSAEFAYNRINYVIFLLLIVPILAYDAVRGSTAPAFLTWIFMFIMINNWSAFRIREKRDFQLMQLPVSARGVGMARLSLIVFFAASYMAAYALLRTVMLPRSPLGGRGILCLFAMTVVLFVLIMMFRDRFIGTKALQHGKTLGVTLLGLGVLTNLYLMFLARRAAQTRAAEPAFVKFIRFAGEQNPANTDLRTAAFVALSIALGFASVLTFSRRKTHVE